MGEEGDNREGKTFDDCDLNGDAYIQRVREEDGKTLAYNIHDEKFAWVSGGCESKI